MHRRGPAGVIDRGTDAPEGGSGRSWRWRSVVVPVAVAGATVAVTGLLRGRWPTAPGVRVQPRNDTTGERSTLRSQLGLERALLDSILEQIPVGVFVAAAPSGELLFHNEMAVSLLRHPLRESADYTGYGQYGAEHGDGTPYTPAEYPLARAVLQGETIHREAMRYRRGDGTMTHFAVSAAPILDAGGAIVAAVSIFDDISELRRAEAQRSQLLKLERDARGEAERRAQEEAALRHAAAAVGAAFTVEDAIQRIARSALTATRADGAMVERIDMETGSVTVVATAGSEVPAIGSSIPLRGSYVEEVIRHGDPVIVRRLSEADRALPAGLVEECGNCTALYVPLINAGEPVGALVLMRGGDGVAFRPDEVSRAYTFGDLAALAFRRIHLLAESERRREELERVMESRARLMRGFSHDVKNPLGAADGQLQLLEDGIVGQLGERQRDSVHRARRSMRVALDLIDDLLELARTEAGEVQIHHAPTDVRDAAREIGEEYRAQADGAGLQFEVVLPDEMPLIESDPARIRQILGNLISNAVKYTPPGGRVEVRVEVRDDREGSNGPGPGPGRWIVAEVVDTGPGIPASEQDLLFQEFTRLVPDAGPGAGVGLAISRRIARALNGEVTVRSRPGAGSTFTLWLPREAWRDPTAADRNPA